MELTAWINSCDRLTTAVVLAVVASVFAAVGGLIGGYALSRQGCGGLAGLWVFALAFLAWEVAVAPTSPRSIPR